jgi:hypothetical protein
MSIYDLTLPIDSLLRHFCLDLANVVHAQACTTQVDNIIPSTAKISCLVCWFRRPNFHNRSSLALQLRVILTQTQISVQLKFVRSKGHHHFSRVMCPSMIERRKGAFEFYYKVRQVHRDSVKPLKSITPRFPNYKRRISDPIQERKKSRSSSITSAIPSLSTI